MTRRETRPVPALAGGTDLGTLSAARASLKQWRDAGWLGPLERALAEFLLELAPELPPSVLVAAALVAALEARGHGNLPLRGSSGRAIGERADPPEEGDEAVSADGLAGLLGWPAEALPALEAAVASLPDAAETQADWKAPALQAVLAVVAPGQAEHPPGTTPLVLEGQRLYLRRYWRYERQVAQAVLERVRGVSQADADAGGEIGRGAAGLALDRGRASSALRSLFPMPGSTADTGSGESRVAEPDWQAIACALALRGRLTVITGGPGTGKTYTAARLLVLLQVMHAAQCDGGAADSALPDNPLRVALAAPTGKAAARLRQSIDRALTDLAARLPPGDRGALGLERIASELPPAVTLHRLLGARPDTRRFAHDAGHPLPLDLLFVDEASMIHLEMMDALLQALPRHARLVLLGDKDQLASVEAGSVMGDLCAPGTAVDAGGTAHGRYDDGSAAWVRALLQQELPATDRDPGPPLAQQTVMLRRSRRFSGPIGELARAVNAGDLAAAQAVLGLPGASPVCLVRDADSGLSAARLAVQGREGVTGRLRDYLERMAHRPAAPEDFDGWVRSVLSDFDGIRVLCALRDGPAGASGLNEAIESLLAREGLLPLRREEWYVGRPVLVTRNDAELGVFNGDVGIVLTAPGGGRRVYFEDASGLRSVSVNRLPEAQTAYAMTVHKSQGSEFAHVVLVLPERDSPVLTRELLYTGITRSREALSVVATDASLLGAAIGRRTRRLSGLAPRLQREGG